MKVFFNGVDGWAIPSILMACKQDLENTNDAENVCLPPTSYCPTPGATKGIQTVLVSLTCPSSSPFAPVPHLHVA